MKMLKFFSMTPAEGMERVVIIQNETPAEEEAEGKGAGKYDRNFDEPGQSEWPAGDCTNRRGGSEYSSSRKNASTKDRHDSRGIRQKAPDAWIPDHGDGQQDGVGKSPNHTTRGNGEDYDPKVPHRKSHERDGGLHSFNAVRPASQGPRSGWMDRASYQSRQG